MLADYGRSSESWSTGLTLMEIVLGRFPFPPEGLIFLMILLCIYRGRFKNQGQASG